MSGTARRRLAALVVGLLAIVAVAGVAMVARTDRDLAQRTGAARPTLALLTSLPLVFGERLSLDSGGSAVLEALERRYEVIPVATADAADLSRTRILFMAHARAQPAETLVALDRWIRDGGRLLLLADPLLERESGRPMGDPLRPSPMFPDTGLLQHWGVRLDAPDQRGAAERELSGRKVLTVSPGAFHGGCRIANDRLLADCRLGKGRAILIADADFLDVDAVDGGSTRTNLEALLLVLADLEQN